MVRRSAGGAVTPCTIARTCLLAFALALGGCLASNESRECPAFGHVAYPDWRTAELGETAVYVAADGSSAIYTVESVVDSEPFVAVEDSTEPFVPCPSSSEHALRPDAETHTLRIVYRAGPREGVEPERQTLTATIAIELADGTEESAAQLALYDLARLNDAESPSRRLRHDPTRVLADGREYTDVIESTELDESDVFDVPSPSPFALRRVVFARGVELVEFDRLDGTTFTRVPDR